MHLLLVLLRIVFTSLYAKFILSDLRASMKEDWVEAILFVFAPFIYVMGQVYTLQRRSESVSGVGVSFRFLARSWNRRRSFFLNRLRSLAWRICSLICTWQANRVEVTLCFGRYVLLHIMGTVGRKYEGYGLTIVQWIIRFLKDMNVCCICFMQLSLLIMCWFRENRLDSKEIGFAKYGNYISHNILSLKERVR